MSKNNLEKLANDENMLLRRSEKALILKIPVPIILTEKGLIAKASTVDYSGTLEGGISIDYDAKETQSKTSFPLSNIEEHQLNFLKFKQKLGGLTFFLIHFKSVYPDKMFITPTSFVSKYWDNSLNGARKSIPLKEFKTSWLTTISGYVQKVLKMKKELLC